MLIIKEKFDTDSPQCPKQENLSGVIFHLISLDKCMMRNLSTIVPVVSKKQEVYEIW